MRRVAALLALLCLPLAAQAQDVRHGCTWAFHLAAIQNADQNNSCTNHAGSLLGGDGYCTTLLPYIWNTSLTCTDGGSFCGFTGVAVCMEGGQAVRHSYSMSCSGAGLRADAGPEGARCNEGAARCDCSSQSGCSSWD